MYILIFLAPKPDISPFIDAASESPMVTMVITEAIPIIIPNIVSNALSLFAFKLLIASLIFSINPINSTPLCYHL